MLYYEKVETGQMQSGMWKKSLKKPKMLKSQESSNCHETLSQEGINGRYRTLKQYVT